MSAIKLEEKVYSLLDFLFISSWKENNGLALAHRNARKYYASKLLS